ncbi:MAG: hypothetical protein HDQ87_06335 [Clostridia bacterium]|nr:hypothetical protein [Clostridia bacterium]
MIPKLTRSTLEKREKKLHGGFFRRKAEQAQAVLDAAIPDEAAENWRKGKLITAMTGAFSGTMTAAVTAGASGGGGGTPDATEVVKNTTNFLLNLLMGVGICFIAFGVLSLAISMQSHDDSQKSKAIMAIVGGAIAVSVRFVIEAVTGDDIDNLINFDRSGS